MINNIWISAFSNEVSLTGAFNKYCVTDNWIHPCKIPLLAKSRLTNENIMENCKSGKPHAVSQHILAVPPPVTKNKPGGVEPTDTFQI